MIRTQISPLVLVLLLFIASAHVACAGDWIFQPSTYSHSPVTGERVRQYAPVPPVIVYQRTDYIRSGYRQSRSTIRAGGSSDNYHTVEQFGNAIRPYGEWLYPNRPYSVPYDIWGPPFGGVNGEYSGRTSVRGRYEHDGARRYRGDRHHGDHHGGDIEHDHRRRRGHDYREDRRIDTRERERYNGLFDGRGIPGDDEHYLDPPSRQDVMNDREFFSRPRSR